MGWKYNESGRLIYELAEICEGNLLGYGDCKNKPTGSVGSINGGDYDICQRCYFKTFPDSTMFGRTEEEIIEYYKENKSFPPADTSMGYEIRDYDMDKILEKMGRGLNGKRKED